MTPHLAPALRQAAVECRRDPDLMAAAALRIETDARLIGRLVTDFARAAGVTEAELMARYRAGEAATSADSGPGAETGPDAGASDTCVISTPQNAREGMRG